MLVLRWSQRAHYWFWVRPKGHIRAPKGHRALWKRPSENLAGSYMYLRADKYVYKVVNLFSDLHTLFFQSLCTILYLFVTLPISCI